MGRLCFRYLRSKLVPTHSPVSAPAAAAKSIWDAQLEHPYVRGIGDGSLDEELFKNWVLQDYRYLKEFARIFAWAVAKSD